MEPAVLTTNIRTNQDVKWTLELTLMSKYWLDIVILNIDDWLTEHVCFYPLPSPNESKMIIHCNYKSLYSIIIC